MKKKLALFLDRDGTINKEVNFLKDPSQLVLINGSAEAIREANELGLKVIVFTNQSGIARGYLTESDLELIHKKLNELLSKEGAKVDAYYYCPHHPTEGNGKYRVDCDCRKPKGGMLIKASKDFGIDLKNSFVVGDRCIDIKAGKSVGAVTILVLTGYGKDELKRCEGEPDFVVENLKEAVEIIKKCLRKGEGD